MCFKNKEGGNLLQIRTAKYIAKQTVTGFQPFNKGCNLKIL